MVTGAQLASFRPMLTPGPRRAGSWLAALLLAVVVAGCASVPAGAGSDPRDPMESLNRQVFAFNEGVDKVVMKPLAEAWVKVLPEPVRTCIGNAFGNLREPSNALNNLLQGKPEEAGSDVCRFAVNTTVGLLGCFDVATRWGFEKHQEDFGQTLGVWGAEPGPYLVVPVFGPSDVRDAIGIYGVEPFLDVNFWIENVRVRNSIFFTRFVNLRAELLDADRLISEAALDKYTFVRDGYLQRRRNLVYDGNPPRVPDPDEEPEPPDPGQSKPEASPPGAGSDVKPGGAAK
jgi:phospholipid-binding lipoprotein MlaA